MIRPGECVLGAAYPMLPNGRTLRPRTSILPSAGQSSVPMVPAQPRSSCAGAGLLGVTLGSRCTLWSLGTLCFANIVSRKREKTSTQVRMGASSAAVSSNVARCV
jgi:hypothetical protein